MNMFLLQLEFSSVESTEAFTESTNRSNASLADKESNNTAPDLRLFWRVRNTKTTISMELVIVSTSKKKKKKKNLQGKEA